MLPSIKEKRPNQSTTQQITPSKDLPSQPPNPQRITFNKVMYHPLTWIAIGLHIVLLVVPLSDRDRADKTSETSEEVPEEAIPIDILNLSDIATSTPPPAAESTAPPLSGPVTAPPSSAAPAPSSAPPSSAGASAGAATAAPTNSAPAPSANPGAGNPASPSGSPPAYDPSGDQTMFIQNLGLFGAIDTTAQTGLPPDKLFRKGNASFFVSNGAPVAGAKEARWMNKAPAAVLNLLETSYQPTSVTITPVDPYGEEAMYEVKTAAGQTIMYVSLVDMKASTLMVMWPEQP